MRASISATVLGVDDATQNGFPAWLLFIAKSWLPTAHFSTAC